MEGVASGFPFPRTVEEVFRDFRGRRSGLLKALTTDVDKFFAECDPEKENLCLFGFRNETWEVNMPVEEVPPEVPEPALGINFARDGMEVRDWLSLVAVHSDTWLLAVAFYYGARFGFDKKDRKCEGEDIGSPISYCTAFAFRSWIKLNLVNGKRLFKMINDLPTLFEILTGKATSTPNNSNKGKPSGNMQHRLPESQTRGSQGPQRLPQEAKDDSGEGEDDEQGATLCGTCGNSYANDEFWICCDVCETWFHGACVKITPAKAEHINHYKCPACSINKRARV